MRYDVRSIFFHSMSWFFTNALAAFLLPPLNLLLIGAVGVMLWHKRPRLARILTTASLLLLWLCATPFVAEGLLHWLEGPRQALDWRSQPADAIVVLGGGTYFHAPEYGAETAGDYTMARLRYGAKLARETGKPILVSGGKPRHDAASEAQQMKAVLEHEFNVPVKWTEDGSRNTWENARYSYRLLSKVGIRRVYLVTHAWHMPRAAAAFREAGFEVVPAPTAYTTRYRTDLLAFLPNAQAMRDSQIFTHEVIGLLWYKLRSGDSQQG